MPFPRYVPRLKRMNRCDACAQLVVRRQRGGGVIPTEYLALIPIAFAGSLVFGLTGFGAALVTIPLATHFVPLQFALALFALTDLASALRIGFENPKNAVRAEWTRLVPMILVGTVARRDAARQPAARGGDARARRVRGELRDLQPVAARIDER